MSGLPFSLLCVREGVFGIVGARLVLLGAVHFCVSNCTFVLVKRVLFFF